LEAVQLQLEAIQSQLEADQSRLEAVQSQLEAIGLFPHPAPLPKGEKELQGRHA